MKRLALTLLALAATMLSPDPWHTVKEQALLLPPGTTAEMRTVDQKKVRGRLGGVADSGFEPCPRNQSQLIDERVPFDRVASIQEQGSDRIVTGVLIGG